MFPHIFTSINLFSLQQWHTNETPEARTDIIIAACPHSALPDKALDSFECLFTSLLVYHQAILDCCATPKPWDPLGTQTATFSSHKFPKESILRIFVTVHYLNFLHTLNSMHSNSNYGISTLEKSWSSVSGPEYQQLCSLKYLRSTNLWSFLRTSQGSALGYQNPNIDVFWRSCLSKEDKVGKHFFKIQVILRLEFSWKCYIKKLIICNFQNININLIWLTVFNAFYSISFYSMLSKKTKRRRKDINNK